MDADERTARTGSEYRNLVSVLNDALRGTDACARYALDAEVTGDERLANVFPKVQEVHAGVARHPFGRCPGGWGSGPGDPGDV